MVDAEREFGTVLAEIQSLLDARDEIVRRLDLLVGLVLDEHRALLDVRTVRRVLRALDDDNPEGST